jgi:structural maintenance of chromosome 3 (chondroitin sulfate proteoglycan 6)
MKQVFGKKLLARSVEAASVWSAKSKMDAITLDGDLCSRKGALTGGYVDLSKSRLRAHRQEVAAKEALAKAESEHQEINRKAQATDQSCTNLIGELQRMEAKQADFNHTISENETEIDRLQNRLENQKKQIEKIEKTSVPLLEHEISSVESEIGRLTEEMGTDLTSTLSDEDREMLANLKKIQTELTTEVENQNEVVAKLSVDRQKLQSLLEDNLLKRRTELLNEGATGEGDDSRRRSRGADAQQQRKEDLEQLKHELDDATRISDDIEARLAEAKKVNSDLRAELSASKSDLEGLKSKDMKNAAELEKAHEEAERLLNKVRRLFILCMFRYRCFSHTDEHLVLTLSIKRSMSVSKRELYMRKIQELGSLPPPASLEKFRPLTISALMRELEKVNKKLKKYSHVNKKAYDQYVNFSEQRESLLKRVEELDNGAAKVKELVESLDRQKDEAINRTFRGVSAHFKDVSDVWMIFASTLLSVYSPFVVSSYDGV